MNYVKLKEKKAKKKYAARNAIFNWNLAREKKSLATPALKHNSVR